MATQKFDSFYSFLARANDRWNGKVTPSDSYFSHSKHNESSQEWDFDLGYDGALRLAKEGWIEGGKKLAEMAAKYSGHVQKKYTPEVYYRNTKPGRLSISRYIQDLPKPYISFRDSEQEIEMDSSEGIIKLVINLTASAGRYGSELFRRGAAVVVLADVLEKSGRRVEIEATISIGSYGLGSDAKHGETEIRIMLKRAEDALEIEKLAFTCAHPAMFRRLGFAVIETFDTETLSRIGHGYGYPVDTRETGDIYIGPQRWNTDAEVEKWVKSQLIEQGVELFED